MKLAMLTPEWYETGAGGIATYCRVLAGYAAGLGHQVTVIAARNSLATTPGDAVPGVRVIGVPACRLPARDVAEAVGQALTELVAADSRPDILEAAEFGGVAALISELPDAPPLVTRLHTPLALILERNEGQRIYRDDDERCSLESRQVAASSALTSPSAWLAREALRLWGLSTEPVVMPNPIPWKPAPRRGRQPGPLRVLYVGRLEHRKGVHVLAQAARLWLSTGGDGQVTFVGGDTKWHGTPMSALLRQAMGPFGKVPTCHVLGRLNRSDVTERIRRADLVVLPSLYENFSYACLEAMVVGTAVVATTGSGFEEILEDGRTGYLVPPGDPRALAGVLRRAARDPSAIVPVAAAARSAARAYSLKVGGQRIIDHLARVAAQERSARLPVR